MRKFLTLKQARELKGWSQEDLEAATAALEETDPDRYARVDQRNISKIENGVVCDPKNSTVATLETALGLKRGRLVFGPFQTAVAS